MGLSYLHKKNWHPPNMENVKGVWLAERRVEETEKKRTEHLKRLKEEKQIEDLKRIQVQQGIIPESSLSMIEWMYQDRAAFNKSEQTTEEYLLGREVKEGDLQGADAEKSKLAKVTAAATTQESYSTTENEAFLRMKDDPLVLIRQREMELRDSQVYNNPLALRKIQREIEMLRTAKKSHKKDKHSKKHKSEKKHKKHHKSRRHSSSDSERSNERRHHRRRRSSSEEFAKPKSRSSRPEIKQEKEEVKDHDKSISRRHEYRKDRHEDKYERRRRSRSPRDYRDKKEYRSDRNRQYRQHSRSRSPRQDRLPIKEEKNLGPDMKLYGARLDEIKQEEQYRKASVQDAGKQVRKLTQAEKEQRALEMENQGKELQSHKVSKYGGHISESRKTEEAEGNKSAKFLSKMQKDAYLESDMKLEDRLNRNRHYTARGALQDEH